LHLIRPHLKRELQKKRKYKEDDIAANLSSFSENICGRKRQISIHVMNQKIIPVPAQHNLCG
jgi:hypothetical protein